MSEVRLKAKHNVSLALKDRWYEVKKGEIIRGKLCNDVISIILEEGGSKDLALYKYKDVSDNFSIKIMKG